MARRRFLPLIAAVALGTAVLVARLAWIQTVEHEVWAEEAANLVRSGRVQPYRRGSILDAKGRELARDETRYRIQFRYREFRRKQPLGIVAHARSALLGAPVAYADALADLTKWTDELLALTPRELDEFARGGALMLGETIVPEAADAARERRGGRRGDARFYLTQLFELDRKQLDRFVRALRERPDATVLEIAAEVRGAPSAAAFRDRLHERLVECSEDLDVLARALDGDARARGEPGVEQPLEALVASLESWREQVADDVAGELFEQALGFHAGRIEPATVEAAFDLQWIATQLGWDAAQTLAWLERARERWRDFQLSVQVERVTTDLESSRRDEDGPERVLDRWSELYASDPERVGDSGWRDAGPLVVLDDLSDLFADAFEPPEPTRAALPFQDAAALGAAEPGSATWTTVARAELGPSATEEEVAALAEPWADAVEGRFDASFVREHTRAVLSLWEQELQRAIREALAAATGGRRLAISEERLDRAGERTLYVVKDRGSRALAVEGNPSYTTVHLLSRHADRFAGFDVEAVNERVRLEDARGIAVAGALVGEVGMPTYREVLLYRDLREDFEELRRKSTRSEGEEAQLRWLARRMMRPDELLGRTGIEAYFDRELTGRNGYVERSGLQERIDRTAHFDLEPEDGSDLTLTLDADLQAAAVETLAAPQGDPEPEHVDVEWLSNPTGAIVLMEVDGDVLAAASYPDFDRGEGDSPSRRDIPYERTLRKPDFQPPGSCWKPFVSVWALDHVDFDPSRQEICAPLVELGGEAGYHDVRCASKGGHGAVGLHEAIQRSCNAYFARLGERFTDEDWRGLAAEFGFGRGTGVHAFGARTGLLEDQIASLFKKPITGRSARLAGNGLAVVEATPMQLARATAGLATGELPEARLVSRVGGVEVPRRSRPLSFSAASLQYVREAMSSVSNAARGSAYDALRESEIGFRMASKTGSGDIATEKIGGRVRKHTWLIGWFPYESPRYVVVVFCYDTLQTATHSSIWVARQFLRRPEVQALLAAGGEASR